MASLPSVGRKREHTRGEFIEVAARLIEDMERAGLVSAMQSNGNREVLAPKSE